MCPVHLACRSGYIRCVHLLLERQADIKAVNNRNENCLHLACRSNFSEITQLLLQVNPHLVDCQDCEENTPLHICAANGSLDCAILLLRANADTNLKNTH